MEFRDEYAWLSNFAPVDIIIDGILYSSVEHAYMSCKCSDKAWKLACSNSDDGAGYIKRQSKNIPLVPNWNNIKCDIMYNCLQQKYNQEPYKSKLISTKDLYIQEGNRWGDTFWGVDIKTGHGKNTLGIMIMKIRSQLLDIDNIGVNSKYDMLQIQY